MSSTAYRALRAVLHIVDGQLQLCQLVDVGVLEEGDAAEKDGVTGALWTEEVNQFYVVLLWKYVTESPVKGKVTITFSISCSKMYKLFCMYVINDWKL